MNIQNIPDIYGVIDKVAKILAEISGYPWNDMPEKGRAILRDDALKVISAVAEEIK